MYKVESKLHYLFLNYSSVKVSLRNFLPSVGNGPHSVNLPGLFCYKLAYEKVKWINYPILGLLFLAVLFPAVSIAVHSNLEQLVGFSPDWSIEKATQWCQVAMFTCSNVHICRIIVKKSSLSYVLFFPGIYCNLLTIFCQANANQWILLRFSD